MKFDLLKQLCSIHAPSGEEWPVKDFILSYVKKNSPKWKAKPVIHEGKGLQDALILQFGKPRTAIFAHMDSIGFTVRYGDQLVKIGGPRTETGFKLTGTDGKGKVKATLQVKDTGLSYVSNREIERGTSLTFLPDFRETRDYVQCCYMDNRLGIYAALKVAETLENGIICFTGWEEHGGGSAEVCGRYMVEKLDVHQALICDITWVTEGVKAGKGVAISLRDSGIPRKLFVDRIRVLAKKSKIAHQLEVEGAGGSDGISLHRSPYAIDWCFIGAPEQFVHSPDEKVHKKDIESMIRMYEYLMKHL